MVIVLAVLQGFRIYYDFSGYTDIAIGLAQLLNLRVPENFDRPTSSTSLQEFWRRWHISLSTWIRDYIYIPLGGNRARRAVNLLPRCSSAGCGTARRGTSRPGACITASAWPPKPAAPLAARAVRRRLAAPRMLGWAICYSFVTYGWLIFFYPMGRCFA